MLTKTNLLSLFKEHDFAPLKRFGENYLIDANIKDKIMGEAGVKKGDVVLEIGPGFGALTIDLAESGAKVFAVEKDKKAFAILQDIVGETFPDLKIYNSDILEFDIKDLPSGEKIKVVGNLPYYITTPIVEYIISNRAVISSALLVTQKEVARRLLADPGDEDYGSISCFVRYYTKTTYIHTIKRTSFYPVPDVDSALIKLEMLEEPSVSVKDEELFFKIVRGAFNQRRKSIINSLSREEVLDISKEKLTEILKRAGIDPVARPESLSLADFAAITNSIS